MASLGRVGCLKLRAIEPRSSRNNHRCSRQRHDAGRGFSDGWVTDGRKCARASGVFGRVALARHVTICVVNLSMLLAGSEKHATSLVGSALRAYLCRWHGCGQVLLLGLSSVWHLGRHPGVCCGCRGQVCHELHMLVSCAPLCFKSTSVAFRF